MMFWTTGPRMLKLKPYEMQHRKRCLSSPVGRKAQIWLPICAVWSRPLLSAHKIIGHQEYASQMPICMFSLPGPVVQNIISFMSSLMTNWLTVVRGSDCAVSLPDPVVQNIISFMSSLMTNWLTVVRGSCKKFCHWVRITSGLRFIKCIFITNLQGIPPLLNQIFVTFLVSREKQINSLLLVSVGNTYK